MSVPFIKSSFAAGEIAPSLFGHVDLARYDVAASTMRNMWVSYRGGSYSRAGTAFVGFSKQTGRAYPPRMVTFQFSINQGLALEFGNQYMRVVQNGEFVTDSDLPITAITRANPCAVTAPATGGTSATAVDTSVVSSYAPGDQVTLAGGTYVSAAVLGITNTIIHALSLASPGTGVYAPADTIALTGGTQSTPAQLTVASTQVVAATIAVAGTGGTDGTQTVTGTTGTGTKFQASVTVSGGAITKINSITVAGAYTANPTTPATEPVTGASLSGAELNLEMGILTFTISNSGIFTANPASGLFTQASTSGSGTGATFRYAVMAPGTVSVISAGSYSVQPANPVAQASTTGVGAGATFDMSWGATSPFNNGDWVQISGVNGMTQLNGRTFVVANATPTGFTLQDVYGDDIDSTTYSAYVSGGVAARIFTLVTPWAEQDLDYLKWTQSADTMSICCWNQKSGAIYDPYDLVRHANNNWALTATTFGEAIDPPSGASASATGSGSVDFQYVITSVDESGNESVASSIADAPNSVDIANTAGSVTVSWNVQTGANTYNVYKAQPAYDSAVPAGALFGYAGTVYGTVFVDSNVVPDLSQVPPIHKNPFDGGGNNNPSAVTYFQQRRVYAGTPNKPDTYFMSQPGTFTNFDTRIPSNPADAITGNPWSLQVNGIQFMVPMPGGLVVLTGLSAWQLTGAGGSSLNPQAITPSNQQAQPQAYNGCSATVPPIQIDYEILYVQAKGSIYRDLSYNFFVNIYTGIDLTQISSHLFTGYTIRQHAWCEEPYKILWAVRDDGILLSLTFLKQQEVSGWARHDTNGLFQSVCSVTEPPVDALYLAVQRFPGTNTAYMIERMNDRIWQSVEDTWCIDAGLALTQPTPNATLTATSATGLGAVTGITDLVGGSNYSSATTAVVVDDNGQGSGTGATASLTIVDGVITAIAFPSHGQGYTYPRIDFIDPSGLGSGASARPVLDNSATFSASAVVFSPSSIGSVIRMGGGVATVTGYTDGKHVTANITSPIVDLIPNSGGVPLPQTSGNWTLTAPVTSVSGLDYLAGATVTGLYDGKVLAPTVVPSTGTIALPAAATSVTLGLGYQCQLQGVYLNAGQPTVQGQRKKIADVTVRLEASRGVKLGTNQPDGSTLSPMELAPKWTGLDDVPDKARAPYNSTTVPLYTGDARVAVSGGYQTPGQVCAQQDNPLPMQVLAFIPEVFPGDTPQLRLPQNNQRQAA